MATEGSLPTTGEVSLISIWMETVLYGYSCVLYCLCMYLLISRRRRISGQWVLVSTSTVLFVLCTVHVAASLRQLLEAFIYVPPGVSDYATLYFVDYMLPIRTLKNVVYVSLVRAYLHPSTIGEIWRLYVVFNRDWRIPIFFLTNSPPGTAYVDAISTAIPNTNLPGLIPLTINSWALDLTVNVSVTLTIAARLWWMGRNVASFRADHSSGKPTCTLYTLSSNRVPFFPARRSLCWLSLYLNMEAFFRIRSHHSTLPLNWLS
ncbi:hypothetical protein J3R82DRAFT_8234 [Butyriboletus roseoflavus]|nr:hypothetical protein J3R82DRAFT_8234 [Butyriboletus roseoflavus]